MGLQNSLPGWLALPVVCGLIEAQFVAKAISHKFDVAMDCPYRYFEFLSDCGHAEKADALEQF